MSSSASYNNSIPQNQSSRSGSGDNAGYSQQERFVAQNAPSEGKAGTLKANAPLDLVRDAHSISGVVDAILEVGRQRHALLTQLRAALESGQEKEALALARRLCGLIP